MTCTAIRTEIGFAILRVRVGTVELLVYLLETIEKNAVNGHFPRFPSDLPVLYHKLHVICDTKPSGLLLAAARRLQVFLATTLYRCSGDSRISYSALQQKLQELPK